MPNRLTLNVHDHNVLRQQGQNR